MKHLKIYAIFIAISFSFMSSCAPDEKEEPQVTEQNGNDDNVDDDDSNDSDKPTPAIPGQTDSHSISAAEIERYIIGSWEKADESRYFTVTFGNDGIYHMAYSIRKWEKGKYICSNNRIQFTPISSSTGQIYSDPTALEYYWTINDIQGDLCATDKWGSEYMLSKMKRTPEYNHIIVGKWSVSEDGYVETYRFEKDGKFRREIYIDGAIYVWSSGTYETKYNDRSLVLNRNASNLGAENSVEKFHYIIDLSDDYNIMKLCDDYGNIIETYNREL